MVAPVGYKSDLSRRDLSLIVPFVAVSRRQLSEGVFILVESTIAT
jgi:hypothetical protein